MSYNMQDLQKRYDMAVKQQEAFKQSQNPLTYNTPTVQTPQKALELQQEQLYQRFVSEPMGIQALQEANKYMVKVFEDWCANIGISQQPVNNTAELSKQMQDMQSQIKALMDQNQKLAEQNQNMNELFKPKG